MCLYIIRIQISKANGKKIDKIGHREHNANINMFTKYIRNKEVTSHLVALLFDVFTVSLDL